MLVRLKRNWFGPNGVRYRARDGLHQVPDDYKDLVPSDAETFDDGGKQLPSRAPVPRPGHGAKPLEEQVLDLIPFAAPSKVVSPVVPVNNAAAAMTEEEREEDRKRAEAATEKLMADRREAGESRSDEAQAGIKQALAVAEDVQKDIDAALDPVASAAEKLGGGISSARPEPAPGAPPKPGSDEDEDESDEKPSGLRVTPRKK